MGEGITDSRLWTGLLMKLAEDKVSEIECNGPDSFFYKEGGIRKEIKLKSPLSSEDYSREIAEGLAPLVSSHDPYNPKQYLFEGPLRYKAPTEAGGPKLSIRARCHIVLPPAADYPIVTIAKKSTSLATLDSIAGRGSMHPEMLQFIKYAVKLDLTVVLSGGTGAGKTTFLEAMTKEIPLDTRIGVAEDTPELELIQRNTIYQHSVPWRPGMDEKDVASLSWVVAQFQRQRTDKIVIGETRGKEFVDFLVAANSGQPGSLTTIHADSPTRALSKMSRFVLKGSPNEPLKVINEDIANSLDLVIQLGYSKATGLYRVQAIEEITPTVSNQENARITTSPLYTYHEAGDYWTRDSNISDDLRKRFEASHIKPESFVKSAIGAKLENMGSAGLRRAGAQPPSSGLPASPTGGLHRR
jgi:Flp pilus assembly CpaF family ATPase